MKKQISRFIVWLMVIVSVIMLAPGAVAVTDYSASYTYNEWGKAIPSPAGYSASSVISFSSLSVGALNSPTDVFYSDVTNEFFIADTGNNRVVITSKDGTDARVIDKAVWPDGTATPFKEPQGVFVDMDGLLYISDTANGRIVICDITGRVVQIIVQPETPYFTESLTFLPQRLVVDSTGVIYVISKGMYNGAVVIDRQNQFLGFFGSNKVEVTFSVIVDKLWKKLLKEDQKSKLSQYIPIEMTALEIDGNDMIYTCTAQASTSKERIRKINSYNSNIMLDKVGQSYQGGFGDLTDYTYNSTLYTTQFSDICVNQDGFILGVDSTGGRIFEYDQNGNLLSIFGGLGTGIGQFLQPVATVAAGDAVYVLDKAQGTLTEFSLTEFGRGVLEALDLYRQNKYVEAIEPWNKVVKMNSNYIFAYIGLGKAHLELADYDSAMKYFKLGHYIDGYNEAYKEARTAFLHKYLWIGFLAFALSILFALRTKLPFVGKKFVARKRKKLQRLKPKTKLQTAFSTALHPIQGTSDLFYKKQWSIWIGVAVAAVFFFVQILKFQYTGFIFCHYDKSDINIIFIFVKTFLLCVIATGINWAFCTLFDGEGKMQEIWIAVTYALIPYIASTVLYILLSNYLTLEEGSFLAIIEILGIIWTAFLLMKLLEACHKYSLKATIGSMAVTVVGIFIIVFVFVLILSLSQQIFGFIVTVVKELMLR